MMFKSTKQKGGGTDSKCPPGADQVTVEVTIVLRPLFWIIVLAAVFFSSLAVFKQSGGDWVVTLTFAGASLGVGATIIAAIYTARNYTQTLAQVTLDRKQKAFDIASEWNNSRLKEPRQAVRAVLKEYPNKTPEELNKIIEEKDLHLSMMFGYFEEVALAIDNHLADDDVLYDQLFSALTVNYDTFKDHIRSLRKNQPTVYCQWERLAQKWKSRKC